MSDSAPSARQAAAPVVAIVGGTGQLGTALARQWVAAGVPVVIGSREPERARQAASQIAAATAGAPIAGAINVEAASRGDVVLIAVPFANHDATLREIAPAVAGKIVIDAVVPLVPPKVSLVHVPEGQSAAQRAAAVLGSAVRVVSAFHNVGAAKLQSGSPLDCDVLVFGDDREARTVVMGLADRIGLRGVDGGLLGNAIAAEALTAVLIGINRRYKIDGAGIRITGLPPVAAA